MFMNKGCSFGALALFAVGSCSHVPALAADLSGSNSVGWADLGSRAAQGVHGVAVFGAAAEPEYEGAKEYIPIPQFYTNLRAMGLGLEIKGPEASLNLRPDAAFQFGPAVKYRMGRDNVSNTVIDRLDAIDGAFEAGGFVAYQFNSLLAQSDVFEVSAELMTDLSGVHEGTSGKIRAGYQFSATERLGVGLETEVGFASDGYMNTYFGVTGAGAINSGLAAYTANGGVKDVGIQATMTYKMTDRWGLVGRASYTRLLGDAADSPIVKDEGSADQFKAGVGLSFAF
ncbi:MipA/OmpV family protein [Labrenzia sp. PHM005]|nr:MipA/OmpV family protein [Labrenzia sp. PHM005]